MPNPHRGAVPLLAGDRTYTLSFSVNALCELEDHLGQPVAKIAATMNKPDEVRLSDIRALIWAGLLDYHEEVTIKDAGDIASEAGIPVVMEAIGKAFALAFPETEAKGSARPRKAANG